jgi:hypothetical protein
MSEFQPGKVFTMVDIGLMRDNDRLAWILDVVRRFRLLDTSDERMTFWSLELDAAPPLAAAYVFMIIWNTERYWAAAPDEARSLLHVFNLIESEVIRDEPNAAPLLQLIKEACPYLVELHESDANWTHFDLPGECSGKQG